jgi:hypothetical protein
MPLHYIVPTSMPSFRRDDFLPIARDLAEPLQRRHRTSVHVAFVFGRGGAMLATSSNRPGTRSRGAGYSAQTIHAERAALKAVGDIRKLAGAIMVVLHIGPQGTLKNSMPCCECQCHLLKCMREYGLRYVYYS